MRDVLISVAERMRIVVHGIDAPRAACSIMVFVHNAINNRIAHIQVWAGHVYFGAKRLLAVSKLAVFHLEEQLAVFFDTAVSVWAVFPRLCKRSSVFSKLLGV